MQSGPDQLVVRQHQRLQCSLPAKVAIADSHAGAVVLARTASEGGALKTTVVDCSRGGLGLQTHVLLPRSCIVIVQLRDPAPGGDPSPIVLTCRVQRVTMTDRTPTFYLGLSFRNECEAAAIERVLTLAARVSQPPPPGGAGGTGGAAC